MTPSDQTTTSQEFTKLQEREARLVEAGKQVCKSFRSYGLDPYEEVFKHISKLEKALAEVAQEG